MNLITPSKAREAIKDYALQFVGTPYMWGGDDPMAGFDCSGFAVEVLKSIGLLKRGSDYTAQGLWNIYKGHKIPKAKKGAFVFYHSSSDKNRIIHVGICLDRLRIVEAGGGGSRTKTVKDAIDQNAYIRIRSWNSRKNVAGFLDPVKVLG